MNAGAARQPPSVFSQACKLHEVIDRNTLFSAEIGNTRLYAALVDWFFNGTRYTVGTAWLVVLRTRCVSIPWKVQGGAANNVACGMVDITPLM